MSGATLEQLAVILNDSFSCRSADDSYTAYTNVTTFRVHAGFLVLDCRVPCTKLAVGVPDAIKQKFTNALARIDDSWMLGGAPVADLAQIRSPKGPLRPGNEEYYTLTATLPAFNTQAAFDAARKAIIDHVVANLGLDLRYRARLHRHIPPDVLAAITLHNVIEPLKAALSPEQQTIYLRAMQAGLAAAAKS